MQSYPGMRVYLAPPGVCFVWHLFIRKYFARSATLAEVCVFLSALLVSNDVRCVSDVSVGWRKARHIERCSVLSTAAAVAAGAVRLVVLLAVACLSYELVILAVHTLSDTAVALRTARRCCIHKAVGNNKWTRRLAAATRSKSQHSCHQIFRPPPWDAAL